MNALSSTILTIIFFVTAFSHLRAAEQNALQQILKTPQPEGVEFELVEKDLEQPELECVICTEGKSKLFKLHCKNKLCTNCLERWSNTNCPDWPDCPFCRAPLKCCEISCRTHIRLCSTKIVKSRAYKAAGAVCCATLGTIAFGALFMGLGNFPK